MPFGPAMPRQVPYATSRPFSLAVGTSGNSGTRLSLISTSRRSLPARTYSDASAGLVATASSWPPSRFSKAGPEPGNGMCVKRVSDLTSKALSATS
ncbi:hypothetical protein G6F64_015529 [Rhizopus arrhizus]|uniref:Uncharacterized protein n=1 Tax=Rhizopus oryzae TaxID=64495 RepID=A0A9P7BGQ6_RHIOR|nr:hypothetical protein G6F68_021373 [Rhizopus microsporus]KAG1272274.1 hypothetical protein G6F64_015529 [Rhizopus arrhizus]